MKDLLVLVADADIQATMRGLLTKRHASLGIGSIEFTIIRHIHRDPGCRRQAASTALSYVKDHEFVLVLFDKDGSGDETATQGTTSRMPWKMTCAGPDGMTGRRRL